MMPLRFLVLIALMLLLWSGESLAYRPFTTEDAGVSGKGVLQTEISYDFIKWKNGDSDQIFLLVFPIYGPWERLEVSVETHFIIHKSAERRSEGLNC
jgi:hypothetical protein